MGSRVALDVDVLTLLVNALTWRGGSEPDAEAVSAARIFFYITNPLITPTVAAEIEQANEPLLSNWKNYHFEEIAAPDDFYRGCVKGWRTAMSTTIPTHATVGLWRKPNAQRSKHSSRWTPNLCAG